MSGKMEIEFAEEQNKIKVVQGVRKFLFVQMLMEIWNADFTKHWWNREYKSELDSLYIEVY